jgi:large subunit ribosomal protein L9
VLPGHIKSTGDHKVQIRLHPEVAADFTLTVVAEK